ncbi:MAG: hypothetical protein IJL07_05930 [Lachnospiraceae bacterium]|nr:hypothetical protein [Clostridia bacterium]MBQ6090778.1 hypothetical protein [Lachnospiraceae bacterium]
MNPILLEMSDNVITALITGAVAIVTTMITATVTYRLSSKKDRNEQVAAVKAELIKYHEKNRDEIRDIRQNDLGEIRNDITETRDDITQMGANLQNKISLLELQQVHTREDIGTLSARVEKHNGVIERTYRLEDNDKLLDEKISVGNHRIADLEEEVRRLKDKT